MSQPNLDLRVSKGMDFTLSGNPKVICLDQQKKPLEAGGSSQLTFLYKTLGSYSSELYCKILALLRNDVTQTINNNTIRDSYVCIIYTYRWLFKRNGETQEFFARYSNQMKHLSTFAAMQVDSIFCSQIASQNSQLCLHWKTLRHMYVVS